MANVRDSDTSLWLHNKLGTSNDSWTGGSICSQLNAEVLRNIKDCFPDLQTQVKLKLLLSFFHIPRRNIEEWRIELEQIIDVAVSDSELWVSMLAEALKTFPATGSLNTEISDLDDVRPIFTDLVNDLKRLVKKQAEHVMLPMECHYLNKGALISVVGQQPAPTKHFTLKKKPKSAVLRADLLQKSNDAASNLKKASAPVIPVRSRGMPRKMTDTTPLKGIPSRVPMGGFRAGALNNSLTRPPAALARPPSGRKEGGVKLLDIADQPLGYAQAKKRKKQEMEDAAAAAAANAAAAAAAAAAVTTATAAVIKKEPATGAQSPSPGAGGATPTPDYALGLAVPSYAPATPQPTVPPSVSTNTLVSPPTPSAATPTAAASTVTQPSTPAPPPPTTITNQQQPAITSTTTLIQTSQTPIPQTKHITQQPTPLTIVTTKAAAQQLLLQQQQQQQSGNIVSAITVPAATAAAAVAAGAKLVAMPAGTVLTATKQQLAVAALSGKAAGTTPAGTTATIIRQIPVSMATGTGTPTVVRPVPPLLATSGAAVGQVLTGTAQNPIVVTRPVQQVTQIRLQPQPAAALQRRGLALTRDQMVEAQEMFRTANKVTRPEKALILGFMAGSRDNPCPHLGNIVTIKLSEDQENVMQTDNTFLSMLVETHFQMNYNNGEWKRIKKYRHMETNIDQLTAGSAQQTAAGLV